MSFCYKWGLQRGNNREPIFADTRNYKATLIDSEQYLLTCMRYIELNPVRAKLVTSPAEKGQAEEGVN